MNPKIKARGQQEIYESEWRALMEEALPQVPPNGKTKKDFAKMWGCTLSAARSRFERSSLRDRLDAVRIGSKVYYVPKKK